MGQLMERGAAARLGPAQGSPIETVIAVSASVAALYLGRTIAIPIAIAVLISFSLGPAVSWLRRRHVGRLPAILMVVLPVLLMMGALGYLITTEVGGLAGNITAYEANIQTKIGRLQQSLPSREMLDRGSAFLRGLDSGSRPPDATLPASRNNRQHGTLTTPGGDGKPIQVEIESPTPSPVELARGILGPLIGPLSDAGLVFLFVAFFLAEKETLRDRLIRLAGVKDLHRTTMAMDEAGRRVSRYLLMQTLVNSAFGIVIMIGLSILGLPNAALWGGMAALLRFIPYLGVMSAAALPLALAFAIDPGWGTLVWTGGLFLSLELVVGNLIEPWLYGSTTGLSALALVVSIIFWTWLWGTIGLLLATPLTVCIAVIGRYVPQLSFLDILLGNEAALEPEESFYQRLLAGDPDEAASQAQDFIKANSLPDFCARVALPALVLAERDWSRSALDDQHLKRIADGVKTVIGRLPPAQPNLSGASDDSEPAAAEFDVVLCVAGRSGLDEAAAVLLVRLLEEEGQYAEALAFDSAIRLTRAELGERRIRAVCLSYLDAGAAPQARYLARRVRRQLGADLCVIVAIWGMEQDSALIEFAAAETRADRVVVSLPAATQAIAAAAGGRASLGPEPEPSIDDLMKLVANAVERPA